jgi:hypothetical protein
MNQSVCPICSSPKKESNKFCSYSCRNKSRVWNDESRQRLSESVKKSIQNDYYEKIYTCSTCGNTETRNVHKNKKERKFYCSSKCAHSRIRNESVKDKISNSVKSYYDKVGRFEGLVIKCEGCQVDFFTKKRTQRFCSRSCASKFNMSLDSRKERSRLRMMKTLESLSQKRRSKNEIMFFELCISEFSNVKHNESIFDGWDADVILMDEKVAVLWNGKWHYEKITERHSVSQVQNRDRLKMKAMTKIGWTPYVIKDMGRHNRTFVKTEFEKFKQWLKNHLEMSK